jgi:hypothetical protein
MTAAPTALASQPVADQREGEQSMGIQLTIHGPEGHDPTALELNIRYALIDLSPDAGTRPERYVDHEVLGVVVPVAESWVRLAGRAELATVAEMLDALPGRRLTAITGWPEYPGTWQASNEGDDGWGSWVIHWPVEQPRPRRRRFGWFRRR